MNYTGIIPIILIIANIAVSYRGFNNRTFFEGYQFEVDKVLVNKDYKRIFTAAFLHSDWMHLVFNMLSLWFFSGAVESSLGSIAYLIIYTASIIGSKILALLVHRHHGDYSSIGASGPVTGIIFACIALFPGMSIGLFFIPIPAWIYGLVYVAFSIYGVRSKKNNIGHEAHLGGALIGMVTALLFRPSALIENTFTILIIAVPVIVFIYIIITRPQTMLVDNLFFNTHNDDHYSIDHQYNQQRSIRQQEIDSILDKISRNGIKSLSKKEREILNEHSKNL
jgi:membrane associated rhomboid family serine protease